MIGVKRVYAKAGKVTLLTAARDLDHSHVTVLARAVERRG
jgi:hypothetical protein